MFFNSNKIKNYRWLTAVLVALLSFEVHADTGLPTPGTSVATWQTYCAVTYEVEATQSADAQVRVERIGKADDTTRFGSMFLHGDELRIWDIANGRQFVFEDHGFREAASVTCPSFSANGYGFTWRDGFIDACRDTHCISIAVKTATMPFTYAAANGGVLVGTSHGDVLLFRGERWCRMGKVNGEWSCPPGDILPIVTEPSNQLYSSISISGGEALVGEFPTGALFQFDGKTLKAWHIDPPPNRSFASESQTMAYYCGELYVGYWPEGEIWRHTQAGWDGPIRLFSTPAEPAFPFMDTATDNGLVVNFFGRRVPSMIVKDGVLYAMTSSKTLWPADIGNPIGDAANEYGALWRLSRDGCAA